MTRRKLLTIRVVPTYWQHKERDLCAARITGLGLTAYGASVDEAKSALEELLGKFVDAHIDLFDQLTSRLDGAGVQWDVEDVPEEDTAWSLVGPSSEPDIISQLVAVS